MDEQKIKEVFSDEAFVTSLLEMEEAPEVKNALADKGIELTLEEIEALRLQLGKADGELGEEDLENVSGGFAITLTAVAAIFGIIGGTASAGSFVHTVTRRRW